ncbi:transposase [Nonomuraea sp. JJY05]|uniref:transposase n=1 Tax=Nonomuraea sp. JJY05 TaxID=3350255 RepID=UPI00373F6E5F
MCGSQHAAPTASTCSPLARASSPPIRAYEEPATGDLVATSAVTRRFDLTDARGERLEPLLPAPQRPGRPSQLTKRQLIDGIRWRVRVGATWRDVPECYGSWRAVYSLSRRWQRAASGSRFSPVCRLWPMPSA